MCVDTLDGHLRFSPRPTAAGGGQPVLAERADRIGVIRYSSGSTGQPKGVPLRQGQLTWTAGTLASVFGLGPSHREIIIAPVTYSGAWGRVAATLYAGGCLVLSQGPLSVQGILEDIETYGATGFFTPPPLVRVLLASPPDTARRALSTCRSIEIGSAPFAARELEQFMDLVPGARVFVHYGLTECSRAVILDTRSHPDKLHTVGRPAPGVEVAIVDDDGRRLGNQQSGEILLRGPQRADSYWNRPELTRDRFVDGWLATGDYGKLDEDGFLTVVGRKDDRINSGGYSFFPAEVEAELGPIEGVGQYLIAGVPDPRGVLGQVPWAFVVPTDPESWSPRDFLRLARKRVPPHMVPRWVVRVPGLSLTSSGKPDRRGTVDLYASVTEG